MLLAISPSVQLEERLVDSAAIRQNRQAFARHCQVYTDFFRQALPDVFEAILDLVDGAPPWAELIDRDTFYAFSRKQNLKALGQDPEDPSEGYLFAAYNDITVKEILQKVGATT